MDWIAAVETNRAALRRVLAVLISMAGGAMAGGAMGGEVPATLPRWLHRSVLRLLRPAEAAARRLVIIVARDFCPAPPPSDMTTPAHGPSFPLRPARAAGRRLTLPMFDPQRRLWRRRSSACGMPRISVPGYGAPATPPQPPLPGDPIDAARLVLRLRALGTALDDLPVPAASRAGGRGRTGLACHPSAVRQPA